MKKLRVSLVDYLNSKPYAVGLQQGEESGIEVISDNPARCADRLLAGEVDLGLVPVAILPQIDPCHLLEGWGIGCDGEVGSVCILSQVPIEETTSILLDYQSRSSNLLAQILCQEFLGLSPRFKRGGPGYERKVVGKVGGLVIGDRALTLRPAFPYVYDLGKLWKEYTGLPFVFALWAGPRELSKGETIIFSQHFEAGLSQTKEIAMRYQPDFPDYDTEKYLTENIKYRIDARYLESLGLFQTKSAPYINHEKLMTI